MNARTQLAITTLAITTLAMSLVAVPAAAQDDASADSGTGVAANDDAPRPPSEPIFRWLGPARTIARSWSASRDTPAMTFGVFPRPNMMGGGELALASLEWPSWTLRGGFAGFVELEWDGPTDNFHYGLAPGASTGGILWRGSYAYYLALTPTDLFRSVCPSCHAEVALSYRHESQHYTGSNAGDPGRGRLRSTLRRRRPHPRRRLRAAHR